MMSKIKCRSYIYYLALTLAFMIILQLNGCSTIKHDGPPPYPVDVSKIPNAVPKVEPLSKYGNKSVYWVKGMPYRTLTSSKGFEERGIASWYGTLFHEHKTSSGERYNMLAMTAAHKTLPLPTYLQVTNLHNGKKIIVKVNDRGPFKSDRIIDLSYVAAKKLGMLPHGTALVDIKAIDPLTWNKPTNHTYHIPLLNPIRHTQYYLQVASFQSKHRAEKLKKRIRPLVSAPIYIAARSHRYQVQVGPIRNIYTVNHITNKLQLAGIQRAHILRYEVTV